MFCSKCGTKNEEGARFCVNCGATLSDKAEAVENKNTVVDKKSKPKKKSAGLIAFVVALFLVLFILASAITWFLVLKQKNPLIRPTPTPTISANGQLLQSYEFAPEASEGISATRKIELRKYVEDQTTSFGFVSNINLRNSSGDIKQYVDVVETVPQAFTDDLANLDFSPQPISADKTLNKVVLGLDQLSPNDAKTLSYQLKNAKRLTDQAVATDRFNQLKTGYKDLELHVGYKVMVGIQYQTINDQLATQNHLTVSSGAWVSQVDQNQPAVLVGGPAAQAGIVAGDIITAINDQFLGSQDFNDYIQKWNVGDSLVLTVVHQDGTSSKIAVKLQAWQW